MSRVVSITRLAKSAGLDPYDVALALIERGVEVDDPDSGVDGVTRKATRAVIREMLGGPTVVRAKAGQAPALTIEPAARSAALLGTLSVNDVLFIHERLCADFATTDDPIDPPGVRSMNLLASAISRQESGYGGMLKYHEPILNAATLLYGLCNDHPFHNGNKRTALVSALAHLDRNRLVLGSTKQRDLFRLMISVASHSLVKRPVKIGRETQLVPRRAAPDEEVAAIANWLRPRVEKLTRGEAQITYRELRQILGNFGFSIHPSKNMKVAICVAETRRGLLRRTVRPKAVMSLDWPGDGRTVSVGHIKHLRKKLKLCEEDGVTREAFYTNGARVDRFINDYRLVLRQLASR
jgi:prophage maintenance system killer protein